jgi:hypothetical protein
MIQWFLSLLVLMCHITFIDLHMLNIPCIYGMNQTWSWPRIESLEEMSVHMRQQRRIRLKWSERWQEQNGSLASWERKVRMALETKWEFSFEILTTWYLEEWCWTSPFCSDFLNWKNSNPAYRGHPQKMSEFFVYFHTGTKLRSLAEI